jgi:membrane protein DedA with SNARE-associated domain
MEYEIWLQRFGYPTLFFGAMVEGETFLFLAGLGAFQGLFSLEWVLLLAFAGTVIGDQIPFYLGRCHGRAFLKKRPRLWKKCRMVLVRLRRHRIKILLFYRFIYGLRGVAPFVFGLTGIRARVFITVSLIMALVWTLVVGLIGYFLGQGLSTLGIEYIWVQFTAVAVLGFGLMFYLTGRIRNRFGSNTQPKE